MPRCSTPVAACRRSGTTTIPRQPLQRIAAEQFDAVNLAGGVGGQARHLDAALLFNVFVNGQNRQQRMTQAPEVMYNAALFYTRGGLSAELEPQTVEQPRQPLQRIAAEQFDAVNLAGGVGGQARQNRQQRMTQAPEVMYNAALFYTRGGLSAEWNYNWPFAASHWPGAPDR
jgi:putative intracellular protease/amidase